MEVFLLFGAMIILIFIGLDIAQSMGASLVIFFLFKFIIGDPMDLSAIPHLMVRGINSFPLLAVPLFILTGELMNRSGVTDRLVDFSSALIGHITGGLGHVNVVTSMIMAGMSGSAVADVSSQGAILVPAMKKAGFGGGFSAALTGAAATIGVIIPPSVPFIIMGSILNISVARLFIAGAIPGILLGFSLMIPCYIVSRKRGYRSLKRANWHELKKSFKNCVLAFGAPFIIMGSILGGIATPTEAGAGAVVYCIFLGAFVYKTLKIKDIISGFYRAALVSASAMVLVAISGAFAWVASAEGFGAIITNAAFQLTSNTFVLLFLVNVLLLILGLVMEPIALMVILSPIIIPFFQMLGVDPIQMVVVFALNINIGLLTPPVGLSLYVVSSVGEVPVIEIIRDLWPFLLTIILVLLAITYIPFLTLWLPGVVF